MFDANNNPARSYVRPIRLQCLQIASKITLIPLNQTPNTFEKIQVICYKEYLQEYFTLESAEI